MDATSHYAVGFILAENGHLPEALEHFHQALTLSKSTDFSIKVLDRQAWTSNAFEDYSAARASCEKALALSSNHESADDEVKQVARVRLLADLNISHATALSALKKHPEALEAWERVLVNEFTTMIFSRLIRSYAAAEDYQGLIDRLKRMDRDQRAEWVNSLYPEDERHLNHAAKVTGSAGLLIQAYREAIEAAERKNFSADLYEVQARYRLAHAYWRVFDNEDGAYRELDHAQSLLYPEDQSETDDTNDEQDPTKQWLQVTVNKLFSELVFSRIHASPVKWVKSLLLKELRKVAKPPMAAKGSWYELRGFNYSTLVAKAFLDHGRKEKTLEILNPIFADSVAALRDDTGDNDCASFRLLARVLAYMGRDRQAQIAYSAQFSSVNTEFEYIRVGPIEEDQNHTETRTERDTIADDSTQPQSTNYIRGIPEDEITKPISKDSSAHFYEEDLSGAGVYCDGCHADISRWTQSFYMCMVCASVDICESCHAKQMARNEGQPFTFWYDYCGKNHTYLRGPLEGWAGVKNGIMTIGEEKIKFEHWLSDVEKEWQELGVGLLSRRGTTPLRRKATDYGE